MCGWFKKKTLIYYLCGEAGGEMFVVAHMWRSEGNSKESVLSLSPPAVESRGWNSGHRCRQQALLPAVPSHQPGSDTWRDLKIRNLATWKKGRTALRTKMRMAMLKKKSLICREIHRTFLVGAGASRWKWSEVCIRRSLGKSTENMECRSIWDSPERRCACGLREALVQSNKTEGNRLGSHWLGEKGTEEP